jgi:hypothetical protein
MSTLRSRVRLGAVAFVGAAALAAASPASPVSASGGDDGGSQRVERSGACSAGATWKLKAQHDDGRVDVEFEVDSNRVGQRWNVAISDNRVVVFEGTRTTMAPSGSFTVERRIRNRAGTDTIRAVATRNGQRCAGRVSL